MAIIHNPVLPGFHPDPSMIRVGDSFYIANSTFEWWPGVSIYESKDLAHWRLAARPLDRVSQLDMTGCHASGGIWAPCLSYADGLFWLVYTNMTQSTGIWSSHNYLVTAPSIEGPWSEPVYLNSIGFDPSLFHDADGRKWFVSMQSDHRPGHYKFGGIALWQYDHANKCMVGEPRTIWRSTHELSEGPHLFTRNGYYYLFVAYGGTGYRHSELLLRSRELTSMFEPDPQGMFLTTRNDVFYPLQRAGHASMVETDDGRVFVSYLCGRPLPPLGRCVLGRETGVAEAVWTQDGWLRLKNGGVAPELELDSGLAEHPWPQAPATQALNPIPDDLLSLRQPIGDRADLVSRPGWLRLRGGEWLTSRYSQALLARRFEHFHFEAETRLDFVPTHMKHLAGLVCYYDYDNWYYLHKTWDDDLGECLQLLCSQNGAVTAGCQPVAVKPGALRLCVHVDADRAQFLYSADEGASYTPVGLPVDASTLSDEYCRDGSFTGAMVGVCCQDMLLGAKTADFEWFRYQESQPHPIAYSLD